MGLEFDYVIRNWRYLQENNYDVMVPIDGPKGTGKSYTAVAFAKRYVELYGFVCPKCGETFFLNCWKIKKNKDGSILRDINKNPVFYLPKGLKRGWTMVDGKKRRIVVQCPIHKQLDLKTGEENIMSGCGHTFLYKDRKIPKWDAAKYIAYDNKDVLDKVFSMPRYSPIVFDEAIKFAAAQNHAKSDSKALKEVFAVIRPFRYILFLNIPDFSWLDIKYREGMSSYWVRMLERGTFVLFEKDKGIGDDHYHIKKLQKMMGAIFHNTDLTQIKNKLKKHPCYQMMVRVPTLSKKVYDNYEMVRNALTLQRQVEEATLSNKDMAKIAMWNIMNNWDNIKMQVSKTKSNRMTYPIALGHIFKNPVTGKSIISEPTARNYIRAVDDYVASKGKEVAGFDAGLEKSENTEKKSEHGEHGENQNTENTENTEKKSEHGELDENSLVKMKETDKIEEDELIKL